MKRSAPNRMNPAETSNRSGYTLIELLVVIGVIGILASMTLPALRTGREQAQKARCLGNFRQLGIGMRLWVEDYGRFPRQEIPQREAEERGAPPIHGRTYSLSHSIGGRDPASNHFSAHFAPAFLRPLNEYVPPSDVYRCGADKGQFESVCKSYPQIKRKPSNWDTIGSSYIYNAGPLPYLDGGGFRHELDDSNGIARKPESWVPDPARYILMHEPPARIDGCG